ncbi:tripartite motif-containing protein 14-like [Mantella aurantiaca]
MRIFDLQSSAPMDINGVRVRQQNFAPVRPVAHEDDLEEELKSQHKSKKCSLNKKILEYYCTEDDNCICVACTLAGEHGRHQVQMLDEASWKKETLRNVLQKLVTTREETEKREAADILLDVNTAHNCLYISDDRKTVSLSDIELNRPETLERFQDCYQVLSSHSFNSGRHYWEVDVRGSDDWRVGMCYPSIDRRGGQSLIGWNKKSWGLCRNNNQYEVTHDSKEIPLPAKISSNRVRIDLDYEAGRISFYDLCEPMPHLHTFTTTFTEPLHAVLWEWRSYIKICGGNQGM